MSSHQPPVSAPVRPSSARSGASGVAERERAADSPLLRQLQSLALDVLPTMYLPAQGLFVFTQRRVGERISGDGVSVRYSAITLIGLNAAGTEQPPLGAGARRDIAAALISRLPEAGLGDTALIAWATSGVMSPAHSAWDRLADLAPADATHATVEVAWALAALATCRPRGFDGLARDIADRLMASFDERSGLFPHVPGGAGLRAHVTCFADQVYPIHALSLYSTARQDSRALGIASRCAAVICERQGAAGQWWWHYDVRTGSVIEGYPVYAIHQDAMAPMALLALAAAGGPRMDAHIARGLAWLAAAPELDGGSLIDPAAHMVWRKVARREPGKTSRYIQSATTRLLPALRAPGLDRLFPPVAIDYEDRPYHYGWLLYAWAQPAPPTAGGPQ
jgi:hypothetical protein